MTTAYNPWNRNRLIRDAMYAAIVERMLVDKSVYILGEGAGIKAHFDCPEIEQRFPPTADDPGRVLTMPISEDANTNFAVGAAIGGVTPIVDVISSDFLYRTMDSICNTAAKYGHTSLARTIVVKAEFLTGGPTTGQRIESLFTHIPGLRVMVPSNPFDAKDAMLRALAHKGVTLLFEDRMIEDATTPDGYPGTRWEDVDTGAGARRQHFSARGWVGWNPIFPHPLVVVSYGIMARRCAALFGQSSRDVCFWDVVDLAPLGLGEAFYENVAAAGQLLIVEPDVVTGGVGAEIAARVAERLPEVAVRRLGAPMKTIPVSHELHARMLPSDDAIRAVFNPSGVVLRTGWSERRLPRVPGAVE